MTTVYQIKNYKSLASGAYEFSLYRDGKRIATVDAADGAQPRVRPVMKASDEPRAWRDKEQAITAGLDEWAKKNVPDWYVTDHGEHERYDPDWETALGYLTDVADMNRLSKKGVLLRTSGGEFYTYVPASGATDAVADAKVYAVKQGLAGCKVWTGTDWAQ